MPGSASSSAAVAVFRSTRPPAPGARGAAHAAARIRPGARDADGDLRPVGDEGGEVDRCRIGLRQQTSGGLHGVGDPGAGREGDQPRPGHQADDRHHHGCRRLGGLPDRRGRRVGRRAAVAPAGAAGAGSTRGRSSHVQPTSRRAATSPAIHSDRAPARPGSHRAARPGARWRPMPAGRPASPVRAASSGGIVGRELPRCGRPATRTPRRPAASSVVRHPSPDGAVLEQGAQPRTDDVGVGVTAAGGEAHRRDVREPDGPSGAGPRAICGCAVRLWTGIGVSDGPAGQPDARVPPRAPLSPPRAPSRPAAVGRPRPAPARTARPRCRPRRGRRAPRSRRRAR